MMTTVTALLASGREQYRLQQRITALGVREARKRASRGPQDVARSVATYQLASASLAVSFTPRHLAEQGITAEPEGRVAMGALLTGAADTVSMIEAAATAYAFDRLVQTLITDAGRTATSVDMGRRGLTRHIRYLNPPSCSRCAVLAGRVYPISTGFQRHPSCDCLMVPTTQAVGEDYIANPYEAFEKGQIRGLSKDDAQALRDGADISQVVNVRRKKAGLKRGSSVIERGGRPTPAGIYRMAAGPDEARTLLRRFGYIT